MAHSDLYNVTIKEGFFFFLSSLETPVAEDETSDALFNVVASVGISGDWTIALSQ
jgi:hypothetical protein